MDKIHIHKDQNGKPKSLRRVIISSFSCVLNGSSSKPAALATILLWSETRRSVFMLRVNDNGDQAKTGPQDIVEEVLQAKKL